MLSAFGVDHGISKGFKRLRPKLGHAYMNDTATKAHVTMSEKLKRHAVEHRMTAGGQGRMAARMSPEKRKAFLDESYQGKYTTPGTRRQVMRQNKVGAHGIYDALGREGRKNKVLP